MLMKRQLPTIGNVPFDASMDEAERQRRRRAASNGATTHVPPLVLKGDEHIEAPDAAENTAESENTTEAVGAVGKNSRGVAHKKLKPEKQKKQKLSQTLLKRLEEEQQRLEQKRLAEEQQWHPPQLSDPDLGGNISDPDFADPGSPADPGPPNIAAGGNETLVRVRDDDYDDVAAGRRERSRGSRNRIDVLRQEEEEAA